MTLAEVDLFTRPEAPGAHHQESAQTDENQPQHADPLRLYRIRAEKMHRRRQHARRCGNRHPYKILPVRSSWIPRLRIVADIESRQPRRAANQKEKTDEAAGLHQMLVQFRIERVGQKIKSPDVRQQARRNAKRNHVGQRIQLLAKIARRVGHARNAPIQRIERNSEQDRNSRTVQVRMRVGIRSNRRDGLRNREVPRADIARCEQRRQKKHAPPEPRLRPRARLLRIAAIQACTSSGTTATGCAATAVMTSAAASGITAITELPPCTRSPTFTRTSASAGASTSTREPNL